MLRAAGQGRGRGGSTQHSRGNAGTDGIVVQAVLLTVMVMTIGLLAVISRVASSRDASSASSLQAAARQAAEFGFSEIVAEMNRDSRSYLWVTPLSSWSSVSQADLSTCNMAATGAPAAGQIEGVSSSKSLPGSSELSYRLTDFVPPDPPQIVDPTCPGVFTNRKGGSAVLTIEGRAQRGSGDVTTYTLRRMVSVGSTSSLLAPFQQSLLVESARSDISTFADFPLPPSSLPNPGPALSCTAGTGTLYTCSDGTTSYGYDNAAQQKFPYPYVIPTVASTSSPTPFCEDSGTEINCRLSSLTVASPLNLIVTATAAKPVNLFIGGTLNLASGAKVCSHASAAASATSVTTCATASGDWRQLRLYGQATGTCPSQALQLNAISSPTADAGKPNLQGAFLWFPVGSLSVGGSITASQADLRGWVCNPLTSISGASGLRIWPDTILGTPRLYLFRGYGSRDLPPS